MNFIVITYSILCIYFLIRALRKSKILTDLKDVHRLLSQSYQLYPGQNNRLRCCKCWNRM